MTIFGVHGSGAQVELAPRLDPGQIAVQRRGWGTVLTFHDTSHTPPSDRFFWIHLAIPTPLSLEDVELKVTVRPLTDPETADAMSVWDGKHLIKAWEGRDVLGKAFVQRGWPVNSKLETGLGLSLKWMLPTETEGSGAVTICTIFGAWAMFERLVDRPPSPMAR